jgi:hypothetical protein
MPTATDTPVMIDTPSDPAGPSFDWAAEEEVTPFTLEDALRVRIERIRGICNDYQSEQDNLVELIEPECLSQEQLKREAEPGAIIARTGIELLLARELLFVINSVMDTVAQPLEAAESSLSFSFGQSRLFGPNTQLDIVIFELYQTPRVAQGLYAKIWSRIIAADSIIIAFKGLVEGFDPKRNIPSVLRDQELQELNISTSTQFI